MGASAIAQCSRIMRGSTASRSDSPNKVKPRVASARAPLATTTGIQPIDPFVFFVGAGVLLAVVVAAASLPARRAAAVDPIDALRVE